MKNKTRSDSVSPSPPSKRFSKGTTSMVKNQFSQEEISKGLTKLVEKFSKISIFVEILNPYFDKFLITRETMPLSMVICEFIAHIYGQLARHCFDSSSKSYKSISICEIYTQIENGSHIYNPKGIKHKAKFDDIKTKLDLMRNSYEKKLKKYCDKHYAHLEVRTPEQAKQDYIELNMSWNEIINLIDQAKNLLNIMLLYWDNSESDFAENQYENFKNGFWELIKLPITSQAKIKPGSDPTF